VTRIINLYGGPGTGKSTSAAFLYYLLKNDNVNAELVREYVKDWAWEKRSINTYDQLYLLGKQIRKESLLYGKTDYVITDSPVLQQVYYAKLYCSSELAYGIEGAVVAYYRQAKVDGYKHHHIFLQRSKPYMPHGRFQTEDEARQIDNGILKMLGYSLANIGETPLICGTTETELRQLLVTIGNS
jgi:hypothetical protein